MGPGAEVAEGLGGGDEGLPLEGAADQVDDRDREVGEVSEGLVLDLAVLSEGASEIVAGVGHPLDGVGDFSNVDCSWFAYHTGNIRVRIGAVSRASRKDFGYKLQLEIAAKSFAGNELRQKPVWNSGLDAAGGTDLQLGASFDRESSAIRVERAVCDELGAHPSRSSARDEVREARPQPRCGVAKRGTDGPARRSSSVSRGVVDGATANSLAADRRGPRQDDQAVKTKLLTGSCLRILDQGLGPTRARSSRNRPLEPLCTMARLAQGWAGHPCHTRRMRLTSTGTPAPDVDALCLVTRWASRKCSIRFTSLAPLRRRAARGSSAHRTRPWPQCRSRQGWSAVFLKPQFRDQHERPGFPTANDHIERPLGRAC